MPFQPIKKKIVLCLPFSPHEIGQARELVKLWVDLEPSFNHDVLLAFISRFDIAPEAIGQDILDYAATKFQIITHQCRRIGVGWPTGCNQLEVGAYEWFVERNRDYTLDIPYIFLAETDTVPLRPSWLTEITQEAYDNNVRILGAYFVQEDGYAHINGNCVIHKDFWRDCKDIWVVSPYVGWDVAIGKEALKYGTPSRLIWQDYRLGAPDNPWRGDDHLFTVKMFHTRTNPLYNQELRPAFIHGIKCMRGIEAVRERFLQKV